MHGLEIGRVSNYFSSVFLKIGSRLRAVFGWETVVTASTVLWPLMQFFYFYIFFSSYSVMFIIDAILWVLFYVHFYFIMTFFIMYFSGRVVFSRPRRIFHSLVHRYFTHYLSVAILLLSIPNCIAVSFITFRVSAQLYRKIFILFLIR